MESILYIGAYTTYASSGPARTEGLFVYRMDTETGRLVRVQAVDAGPNPSFLTASSDGRFVFAANEQSEGQVSAFQAGEDGRLEFINRQPVHGADPCYISLSPSERWLLAACYSSGSFTVMPLDEAMHLQPAADLIQNEGRGADPSRQEKAHAHCIRFSPGDGYVFGVDLGMDRVWVYRFDESTGRLTANTPPGYDARPGAGPRHLAYSLDGRYVYIANELDSTVTACAWDAESGRLAAFQTQSALQPSFSGENTVADIHLTPSGEFLYVSNRGEDSLAAFRVDPSSGQLQPVGSYPCGGRWPRNFAIHPQGKFLLVANQYSDNVVVFHIEHDGSLVSTGIEIQVPAPVNLLFRE